MRKIVVAALCAAVLLPGLASAGTIECRRMTMSIAHYERMHAQAKELNNDMWEERTKQHVKLLRDRRAMECPEYSPKAEAARLFRELTKLAASAAAKYFTAGMF